jgi:hypothetical protein
MLLSLAAAANEPIVSMGDSSRIDAVFAKAYRGEPIKIAGIGGSIVAGAGASAEAKRFLNIAAKWWSDTLVSTLSL